MKVGLNLPGGELGPTMKVRFNLLWRARPNYEDKIQPPGGELGPLILIRFNLPGRRTRSNYEGKVQPPLES